MKILLLSFEFESEMISEIALKLHKEGHKVRVVQSDATCVTKLPQILKTYHENGMINNVNTVGVCLDEMTRSPKEPDWKYLKEFERRYSVNKNLMQLGMTDPILFDYHHYRRPYYYGWKGKQQPFTMIEYILRWLERIFDEFSPDIMFSIDRNYFIKNAAAIIAEKKGCSVLSLFAGRIASYWGVNRVAGFPYDDPKYSEYMSRPNTASDFSAARNLVENMISKKEGLYLSRSRKIMKQKNLITVRKACKVLLSALVRVTKNIIKEKIHYMKGGGSIRSGGGVMESNALKVYAHYFRIAFNQIHYVLSNPFECKIPDVEFILFPLHTLPESSTLTYSTEYYEADLIRFISKELPANMYLVVKENANMVGERFWGFYKEVEKLPNIIMLDPMVPTSDVISLSKGVTGITGTALLEAVLMNVPTHCFGDPEFLPVINSHGYSEFGGFAVGCQKKIVKAKRDHAVKHVQYVIDSGLLIDINSVRKPGYGDTSMIVDEIIDLITRENNSNP